MRPERPRHDNGETALRKPRPVGLTDAEVVELERLAAIGYGAATIARIAKLPQDLVRIWFRQRAEAHDKGKTAATHPGDRPTLPRVSIIDGA